MNNKEEFFIGYQTETPPQTRRLLKRVVIGLIILLPILGGLMALLHKQYSTGKYEFGKLTEIEGFINLDPIPILKITAGEDQNGNAIYQSIPLVGYGKFGARGIVDAFAKKIKSESGKSLGEVNVVLQGTLAYNDGKAIFELTKKENALINYSVMEGQSLARAPEPVIENLGNISLKGEIIDPKCYFGAMNPGRGKSHKSCAIMCIRGGIPPMLAVKTVDDGLNYYILLGQNRQPVNEMVLEFVADPVEVSGQLQKNDDWFVLLIDPATGIKSY